MAKARIQWSIDWDTLLTQLHAAETQLALERMRFSMQRTSILGLFSDATLDVEAIATVEDAELSTTDESKTSAQPSTSSIAAMESHHEEMVALWLKLQTTMRLVNKQQAQNKRLCTFLKRLEGAHESPTPMLQLGGRPSLSLQRKDQRSLGDRLLLQ